MPTTAERRALWFLAGTLTLGAGVRAAQAHRAEHAPSSASAAALDRQLAAVDSARLRQGHRNRGRDRGTAGASAAAPDHAIAGVLPPGTRSTAPGAAGGGRIASIPSTERRAPRRLAAVPVDVDRADASELELLPGIGPTLAARTVADRSRNGAFGSLAGLARVKGIGMALSARLAPHVLFSGIATIAAPLAGQRKSAGRRSNRVSSHAIPL